MKKIVLLGFLGVSSLFFMIILTCCTKVGPAGPAGIDGVNGENGANGTANTDVCLQCHSTMKTNEIKEQYDLSFHATSSRPSFTGKQNFCSTCHSHEGSVDFQVNGTASGPYSTGNNIRCKTCHGVHYTFDFENDGYVAPMRTTGAVGLFMYNFEQTLDLGGSSNVCVNCHQPRDPLPNDNGTGSYYVRADYGPHHGPQSVLFEGIGGVEMPGDEPYPAPGSSDHRQNTSCVKCHMYEYENGVGGHSLKVNIAGCQQQQCHSSASSTDVNGVQTEVRELLDTLKVRLIDAGILNAYGGVIRGTYPIDTANIFYNYMLVFNDHSDGVHNPDYIKALLKNSIQFLSEK